MVKDPHPAAERTKRSSVGENVGKKNGQRVHLPLRNIVPNIFGNDDSETRTSTRPRTGTETHGMWSNSSRKVGARAGKGSAHVLVT